MEIGNIPIIYGWNSTSESGPDVLAPSIFTGGCNFRCDYCMNAELVLNYESMASINLNEVSDFVKENNCKWVNISGGEPTIHPVYKLLNLFDKIRKWGCKIALSTNGFNPCKLSQIINDIHYVTMDIKTGYRKYYEVCILNDFPMANVLGSLHIIKNSNIDHEIRTTLYPKLVGESEIREIGEILDKNTKWILQPYRKTKNMIGKEAYECANYNIYQINNLRNVAQEYCDKVYLRHV